MPDPRSTTYTESAYRGWTIRHERMGHVNIITPDGQWAGGQSTTADARRRIDALIDRAETVHVSVPWRGRTAMFAARRAPTTGLPVHGPDPRPSTFDRYRAARASVILGFDCAPAPRDLEMVHGPWDERTASLMVILHRSNVARAMRPEGSTLAPAIGLPVHGPAVSVRHERATRIGMRARRGVAADNAYRTLLFMGAAVTWRRVYDTGIVHGPERSAADQRAADRWTDAYAHRPTTR
jgi:hypothetical protein